MSQFELGFVYLCRDDLVQAEEALQTAQSMAERIGDIALEARCLTYLTVLRRQRGQVDQVRRYLTRSLEAATAAHMPNYLGAAQANLGWLAWREGDLSEAAAKGKAALELWQPAQKYPFYWLAAWPLIGVALARERFAAAVTYARELLDPVRQRLPAEMEVALERSIEAWMQGKTDVAKLEMQRAAEMAASMGHL